MLFISLIKSVKICGKILNKFTGLWGQQNVNKVKMQLLESNPAKSGSSFTLTELMKS